MNILSQKAQQRQAVVKLARRNVCVKCSLARLFPTECEWTRCSCRAQGFHIGTAKLTAGLRCLPICKENKENTILYLPLSPPVFHCFRLKQGFFQCFWTVPCALLRPHVLPLSSEHYPRQGNGNREP